MPKALPSRRRSDPSTALEGTRSRGRKARPRVEALENRIALAHNITIASGGLATIPSGATNFADTGDYTIDPGAINNVATGTLTLRANNDIVLNGELFTTAGVRLTMLAGRNLTLNAGINFFQAPLELRANAATALGVNQANRDAGDASLTINSGVINASSSNSATLIGDVGDQAGANAHPNAPVRLLGTSQVLNSTLTLWGRGNASNRAGIFVASGAKVAASNALTVTLSGAAFNGTQAFNPAIDIRGAITAVDGGITINGTGAGTGSANYGVHVLGTSAKVQTTGRGPITINGTGGGGTGSFGIELDGAFTPTLAQVQSAQGAIRLNGTGGPGAYGVSIEHGSQVKVSGAGEVVINGGANGISFNPFGAGGGSVSIATGNLTLIGDVINLDAIGSIASSGTASELFFQPGTDSRPIVLGGGGGAGALVFNDTARAALSGFRKVTVGSATSTGAVTTNSVIAPMGFDLVVQVPSNTAGGVTISRTLDVGANTLTLVTGGAIKQVSGGLLKAATLVLQAATGIGAIGAPLATQSTNLGAETATGGVFIAQTGDVTVGSAPLKAVRTTSSGNLALTGTGNVTVIAGGQVSTNGGSLTISGDGRATNGIGILVNGGTIDGLGGDLSLTGIGSSGPGIAVRNGGQVRSSGLGRVTLSGTGSLGVRVSDAGSIVSSVDGSLSITGTSPNSTAIFAEGVQIISGGVVQATGSGGVTLNGTGSPNGTSGLGVSLFANATVSVNIGPLNITGVGQGVSGKNNGVNVEGSTVRSTGSGAISIQGTAPAGASAVAFNNSFNGGTGTLLAGTGNVVVSGGLIDLKTATLNLAAGGRMTLNGSTTLGPGTTLTVPLNATIVKGPAFIQVNGQIDLGGASLQAVGGGVVAGAKLTLISNDGSDAVVGSFAQGSGATLAGDKYQINTKSGDGNDVVLTRPNRPVTVRLVTKVVTVNRRPTRLLFLQTRYNDNGQFKSEVRSPFQAPTYRNVRITTADTDKDGAIDRVTVFGTQGTRVRSVSLSV